MEFLLDTIDISEIEKCLAFFPISGITSNPSIIKQYGKVDFFSHFKDIQSLIGAERSLHIQMVSEDADGILAEAYSVLEKIDHHVIIKIPVTEQGLKAIQILKKDDAMVTATAIYTEAQALLATAAGADYLAVYYNRMENMDIDPCHVISATAKLIEWNQLKTNILGASFKNMGQVQKAFEAGANAVTVQPSLLHDALKMPAIQKAVDDFRADWAALYGNVSIDAL
mgnify:FL=1